MNFTQLLAKTIKPELLALFSHNNIEVNSKIWDSRSNEILDSYNVPRTIFNKHQISAILEPEQYENFMEHKNKHHLLMSELRVRNLNDTPDINLEHDLFRLFLLHCDIMTLDPRPESDITTSTLNNINFPTTAAVTIKILNLIPFLGTTASILMPQRLIPHAAFTGLVNNNGVMLNNSQVLNIINFNREVMARGDVLYDQFVLNNGAQLFVEALTHEHILDLYKLKALAGLYETLALMTTEQRIGTAVGMFQLSAFFFQLHQVGRFVNFLDDCITRLLERTNVQLVFNRASVIYRGLELGGLDFAREIIDGMPNHRGSLSASALDAFFRIGEPGSVLLNPNWAMPIAEDVNDELEILTQAIQAHVAVDGPNEIPPVNFLEEEVEDLMQFNDLNGIVDFMPNEIDSMEGHTTHPSDSDEEDNNNNN